MRELRKATDHLQSLVTQWHAATEHHEPISSIAVLEKVKTSDDRFELLALDNELWRQVGAKGRSRLYEEMSLALIKALHDNQSPAAAESLARYAIFSESENVRETVIKELNPRPKDQYVPLLLSGLQSPIQLTQDYFFTPEGFAVLRESIYCEGTTAAYSKTMWFTRAAAFWPQPIMGRLRDPLWRLEDDWRYKLYVDVEMQREGHSRYLLDKIDKKMQRAVDTANRDFIAQDNAHIIEALRNVTGVDMGDDPASWVSWWQEDYNEQFNPYDNRQSKKPLYISSTVTITMPSCFAPGTKVWTLTGFTSIELIRPGDCVLSQDVESGELAYKPVLTVTYRPPGQHAKITVGSETIDATPGHPFWVDGQGWRLTKQLNVGERFHTLSGGASIESIEKLDGTDPDTKPAFNLIVADFSSYFVGEQGILVHDNTPRKPTAALVPGLAVVKHAVVETVAE
jgi:hypothetical protein